jgi:hypothetical protein
MGWPESLEHKPEMAAPVALAALAALVHLLAEAAAAAAALAAAAAALAAALAVPFTYFPKRWRCHRRLRMVVVVAVAGSYNSVAEAAELALAVDQSLLELAVRAASEWPVALAVPGQLEG